MSVKPLTDHHLEFLSLKGGCTGLSESTLVKIATLFEITFRGSNRFALAVNWLLNISLGGGQSLKSAKLDFIIGYLGRDY